MKSQKEFQNLEKETVFDLYSRLIEEFENYEDIENEEMLKEIITIYKDYKNIISICTFEELESLQKILKKKNFEFDKSILENLENKLLISITKNQITIPEEIKRSIKKAVRKVSKEEKIAKDRLNKALIGICKIYGIVSPERLCDTLISKVDISKEEIEAHLKTDRYFKYYTYEVLYEEKEYFIYEPFYYFEEELVYTLEKYQDIEYADITLEDMEQHFSCLFDPRKESIRNFLDKLKETGLEAPLELFSKILEFSVLDYKREDLFNYLTNRKGLKKTDKEKLINLLEIAMNDMPSAALKGHTPNELNQILLQKEYEKQYQKAWDKTKEEEIVQDYKSLREEAESLFEDCVLYLVKNHQEQLKKITRLVELNQVTYNFEDSNALNNLIFFHTIEEGEESLFSKYIKEGINVLSKKYKIAWQIEESATEALFQIKKLNPNKGIVKLKCLKTKEEYDIFDIALSCGSKNLIGSYLYTTLVKVNKITFATGYAYIFQKTEHENIEKELEKIKKSLKGIKTDKMKNFIACKKLFESEKITFSARPLE